MSKSTAPTFDVDREGLAKLLERRGKEFAITELIQNAWDEDGVTQVEVLLEEIADRPGYWNLVVEDDAPEGFKDLAHAYTLFAESEKKGRADQRGRFNLGEKLVIAICDYVQIGTTTGFVEFTDKGRNVDPTYGGRAKGSRFMATLRMSEAEAERTAEVISTLLPPPGITTRFNGLTLQPREPVQTFDVTLRTELADAEGYLRPTRRKTTVAVYDPNPGETASLYEMGIPVVETGDRWHVDIGQKVPLNTDRDNVPPGYLRDVRAAVLNACAALLQPEDATGKWVDDALEDESIEPEAVKAAVTGRYGDNAVIEDRTDPEGTKIAMSKGMTVIPGGAFSKAAWKAVKTHDIVKPAGQVTPSPKPHEGEEALDLMDPEHYPEGVRIVVDYAKALAERLLDAEITVRVANAVSWPYLATYGPRGASGGQLTLNYGRLGHKWFAEGRTVRVDDLLLHEFAHHRVPDHLSNRYHEECTRLGAKMVQLALDEPELLRGAERQAAKV